MLPAAATLSVVIPVYNERATLLNVIRNVLGSGAHALVQHLQIVVVDDGSTDGTGEILDRRAAALPWMTVLHRKDGGHRASGGGVVEAFNTGYGHLAGVEWEYLVKLDGDLSFDSDYFRKCFQHSSGIHVWASAGGRSGRLRTDTW